MMLGTTNIKLISPVKVRTQTGGASERSAKQNMWTYEEDQKRLE
jgi:hypothetical protein